MISKLGGLSVKHCRWAWIGLILLVASVNAGAQSQLDLKGAIDFRVHSNPEAVPRSIDADDVARLAKENGMRALVLCSHSESTAAVAYIVRKQVPGIEVFGGIMLNHSVGGLNTEAVKRMLLMKGGYGRVVWFPTSDAEHFYSILKLPGKGVPVSKDGHLVSAAVEMIDLISKNPQLVLATGHISAEEILLVTHEAHARGVKHIVVNNPLGIFARMTPAQMQMAIADGAYLEFVYNSVIGDKPQNSLHEYAEGIKQAGPQHIILGTDFGATEVPNLPFHPQGLLEFMELLRKEGISVADINMMVKTNPARVLELEP
jgi:hypothetical protein